MVNKVISQTYLLVFMSFILIGHVYFSLNFFSLWIYIDNFSFQICSHLYSESLLIICTTACTQKRESNIFWVIHCIYLNVTIKAYLYFLNENINSMNYFFSAYSGWKYKAHISKCCRHSLFSCDVKKYPNFSCKWN